jgi:hypothetical protein
VKIPKEILIIKNVAMAAMIPIAVSGPVSGMGGAILFFLPVITSFYENCYDSKNYSEQSVTPISIPTA